MGGLRLVAPLDRLGAMIRLVALLALFLIFDGRGWAEESNGKSSSEELEIGVWRLPPGFVSMANPSDKDGARTPLRGFETKKNTRGVQYDGKRFLEEQGVKFPEGAEAVFDQSAQALMVRNTKENLELIESILAGCGLGAFGNIAIEFSVYECALLLDAAGGMKQWPTYAELTSLPAASRKFLDNVSVMGKSGQRMTFERISEAIAKEPKQEASSESQEIDDESEGFRDGELGTKAEADVVVGPDGVSVDVAATYRSRFLGSDGKWSEVSFVNNFQCQEGYPLVIYASALKGQEGKFVVVTATARVLNEGGWKVR